jgi:hypothetical protein
MVEGRQQLIIHSGAFKTATSAVQIMLMNNAELLLRKHGVLVPHTLSRPLVGVGTAGARSHNLLGHLVKDFRANRDDVRDRLVSGLASLADEIRDSGAPTAVISAEMLTGIDEASAIVIRDCLRQFDLRIVYSVRRVDEYFESLARQQFKLKSASGKVMPPYTSPFGGLISWANVLGDDAVSVLVYGFPARTTAVRDVFRAMGIDISEGLIGENLVRNPSFHADGVLLRRALTRYTERVGLDASSRSLREDIVRRVYRLEARLDNLKPLQVYSKAERLAIFDATAAAHEDIARRFLSKEQAAVFLARDAIEALDDSEPPHWNDGEVMQIVDELCRFVLEHPRDNAPISESELEQLRKGFRIARKRNAQFRDRIKELEARLGDTGEPQEGCE